MPRQVAVVGTGWVGTSVAISVLHAGLADELLLYDVREEVARGEAMDLAHGASFYPHARVRFAPPEEMAGADAVVIAAGRGGRADESRLALARDNAAVVRTLGRRLTGHRGLLVMVTNPVDVLTRVLAEVTGLPPARGIGTGTTLDTARLRHALAGRLAVDPRSVHAQVVGEHGDSEVILSSAKSSKARSVTRMIWSDTKLAPSRAPSSGCFRQHSHSTTAQPGKSLAAIFEKIPTKSTCPSPRERNRPARSTQGW
jgi:L-lactate dehydrogenase